MATKTQIEYTCKSRVLNRHTTRGMYSKKQLARELLNEGVWSARVRYQMNNEWQEWTELIKEGEIILND